MHTMILELVHVHVHVQSTKFNIANHQKCPFGPHTHTVHAAWYQTMEIPYETSCHCFALNVFQQSDLNHFSISTFHHYFVFGALYSVTPMFTVCFCFLILVLSTLMRTKWSLSSHLDFYFFLLFFSRFSFHQSYFAWGIVFKCALLFQLVCVFFPSSFSFSFSRFYLRYCE